MEEMREKARRYEPLYLPLAKVAGKPGLHVTINNHFATDRCSY